MQLRLGRAHIGAALHQLRGHAQRQIRGQHQLVQLEAHPLEVGRQMPGQRGQLIAGLMQLLVQGRQRASSCRERGILRIHIGLRDGAQLEFAAHDIQRFTLQGNHMLRGGDLRSQTGFLDGRRDHIRGQGQVGGIELIAARLGLRGQRLHRPSIRAEHIGT
jgi:hypothetical protein